MKKIVLLIALPAVFILTSCGGAKTEETVSIPGMMETEIVINGNKLSVMVPDSTKGKLESLDQQWGATELKVGKNFQISIEEGEGDIVLAKSDIAGDDVFKLQRYIKDEPTIIFWESKNDNLPDSRFHFYAVIKSGEKSYIVRDVESGDAYTEKDVQSMVDAANTLKLKPASPPNS